MASKELTEEKGPAMLGETKIEQLSKQPIIESSVSKSADGKWVIHRTTITDIKPVAYLEKVLGVQ